MSDIEGVEGEGERVGIVVCSCILEHIEASIVLTNSVLGHTDRLSTANAKLIRLNQELQRENDALRTRVPFWRSPEYWCGACVGVLLWISIYFLFVFNTR